MICIFNNDIHVWKQTDEVEIKKVFLVAWKWKTAVSDGLRTVMM